MKSFRSRPPPTYSVHSRNSRSYVAVAAFFVFFGDSVPTAWRSTFAHAWVFLSWQWQLTGVWTVVHRRTCRTTAFRPPVSTLGSTCVPSTVNCLQYLATGSTLMAVGPFQLPAQQSGTLSRISSETRPSVQTLSDVCLKRTCSLDTSAFSALEVLDDNRAL